MTQDIKDAIQFMDPKKRMATHLEPPAITPEDEALLLDAIRRLN